MILRTQIPVLEVELLNQAHSTSQQLLVQVQMVSLPCQVVLKEALGANKLCAGQDLDLLAEPLKQRRVAGTMSQLQGMKFLEKMKIIKQVMILDSKLRIQEYQRSQHHLTSIHLVMVVHLNNL